MTARAPAITTPTFDVVLTGGLSALVMGGLLGWSLVFGGDVGFVDGTWLVPLVLVNAPHFMASYRLLYVSREEILANRWSTLFVPAALVFVLALAAFGPNRGEIVRGLVLVSSVYLAWHYTGQAWGMVSAFSRVLGVEFTALERTAIRAGMRILLALHVLYALSGRLPPAEWIAPARYVELYGLAFQGVVGLAGASLLAGAAAFVSAGRRGQRIPARVVLPWLALYLWYPFWYFVPGGFVWVQLSHALQYMAFPLRVEANRFAEHATPGTGASIRHVVLVYGTLVAAGAFLLHGPPIAAWTLGHGWYSTPAMQQLFQGFVACVAIHHYFVDGAIWKLSNPKVRGELLRHLRADAPA